LPKDASHTDDLTVAEAAQALGVSRQAIEGLVKRGLPHSQTERGVRVSRQAVAERHRRNLLRAQQQVAELTRTAERYGFGSGTPVPLASGEPPPASAVRRAGAPGSADPAEVSRLSGEVEGLRELIGEEKTGRALAEARITQLLQDIRRLNKAVDALKPEPDLELDSTA